MIVCHPAHPPAQPEGHLTNRSATLDILYRGYVQTAMKSLTQLTNVTRENQIHANTEFRSLKVARTYKLTEQFCTNCILQINPCLLLHHTFVTAIEKDLAPTKPGSRISSGAAASRVGEPVYDYRDKCLLTTCSMPITSVSGQRSNPLIIDV